MDAKPRSLKDIFDAQCRCTHTSPRTGAGKTCGRGEGSPASPGGATYAV